MKFLQLKKKRIYLDYAAATPVRTSVANAMRPYETDIFANPSAIHQEGVTARAAIEQARQKLARILKIRPTGIVFTASGTESNNLALLGTIEARHAEGLAYTDMEVVATAIEHPSVARVLDYLETQGVTVRYASVDHEGILTAAALAQELSERTVLVTFAYANSEIGVVQEVGKLARTVRAFEKKHGTQITVHTDGAQAPLWLSCEMDRLMVDILTLDAGKCYGPKGVGVLAMRHGVSLTSVTFGGSQEGGLRPGTENTPGIIGAVEAIVQAQEQREPRVQITTMLRDATLALLGKIEGVVINGSRTHRIANNINISIPGIDSEFAVIVLDEAGVACSTKSACAGASGDGSTVVWMISEDAARASSTIRFSLGEATTAGDTEKAVEILSQHVLKMRESLK